ELAGAYNFGPDASDAVPVRELVEFARDAYGSGEVRYGGGDEGPHESAWLSLDAAKAAETLGVSPKMALTQAVLRTMAWYRAHDDGADARELCQADLFQ